MTPSKPPSPPPIPPRAAFGAVAFGAAFVAYFLLLRPFSRLPWVKSLALHAPQGMAQLSLALVPLGGVAMWAARRLELRHPLTARRLWWAGLLCVVLNLPLAPAWFQYRADVPVFLGVAVGLFYLWVTLGVGVRVLLEGRRWRAEDRALARRAAALSPNGRSPLAARPLQILDSESLAAASGLLREAV